MYTVLLFIWILYDFVYYVQCLFPLRGDEYTRTVSRGCSAERVGLSRTLFFLRSTRFHSVTQWNRVRFVDKSIVFFTWRNRIGTIRRTLSRRHVIAGSVYATRQPTCKREHVTPAPGPIIITVTVLTGFPRRAHRRFD